MATANGAYEVLGNLQSLQQSHPLGIIRISEPIAASANESTTSPSKRTSDASTEDAFENPSPASLEADLTHYKELFSKLRFSYIEQVTKEKFLRAIVGDPPLVVGHAENVELEAQLAELKKDLQARKEEVKNMVAEMEQLGRSLTRRWENVNIQTAELERLPGEIEGLEKTVEELRKARGLKDAEAHSDDPDMNLSLQATQELLRKREEEERALDRRIAQLQAALPGRTREADAVERELGVLERRKTESVNAAREAKRRKETGGRDELEERGRWYAGVEKAMIEMVGVDA